MGYDEIDQSLYSRLMIGGDNNEDIIFFNASVGQYDKDGKKIGADSTNMYMSSNIYQMFSIRAIRFVETLMDNNVREHLLKYASFTVSIKDRDRLIYPVHLMTNYFYFLEKKLKIPILVNPCTNFSVELRMKNYPHRFQLTCELLGINYA